MTDTTVRGAGPAARADVDQLARLQERARRREVARPQHLLERVEGAVAPRRSGPTLVALWTGPTSVVGPGSQASPGSQARGSCGSPARRRLPADRTGERPWSSPVARAIFLFIRNIFIAAQVFSGAPRSLFLDFPRRHGLSGLFFGVLRRRFAIFPNFRPVRICLRHAPASHPI